MKDGEDIRVQRYARIAYIKTTELIRAFQYDWSYRLDPTYCREPERMMQLTVRAEDITGKTIRTVGIWNPGRGAGYRYLPPPMKAIYSHS